MKFAAERTNFSQIGAAMPPSAVKEVEPPAVLRHWKLTPWPAEATMLTLAEPALVSLRNMTPALDQPDPGSLFCTPVTWTIIVPSPLKLVLAKLNWSAAFQISAPPPVTVQVPLS